MFRVRSAISYQILPFLLLFFVTCCTKPEKNRYLCDQPLSCGNITNISYPFGLKGGPDDCGDPNYLLSCENNETILHLYSGKYLVKEINRTSKTIRIIDTGLQKDNCSSLPLYPLTYYNLLPSEYGYYTISRSLSEVVTLMNCENSVNSSLFIKISPCVDGIPSRKHWFGSSKEQPYWYVMLGDAELSEIPNGCRIYFESLVSSISCKNNNCSYLDIYHQLLNGIELSWSSIHCKECERVGYCIFNDDFSKLQRCSNQFILPHLSLLLMAQGAKCFCGTPCVFAFLIYKWRRRHLSMYDNIEDFLRNQSNLIPIMYSYSDIKKITKGFKDKLGEGGYGSVYKGKLSSGRIVAIKLLSNLKANGQDFINEVATIGRIHHVNVVQLVGFCAERSKRALVYDFMPNGSLEKYIFSQDKDVLLSCESMYKISLGIARGIEYLHRGCDMQILHFDIKPHNILLDENFTPKVSDFGLAKLYPTQNSIVSLTAPRGTMGYMAPELFYKNIGGISYKADIYSFEMLLMEMAGRRKNLNAFAELSSQIYFPSWVYDQFIEGKDVEMENLSEEEKKTTKKMLIVALCVG